MIAFDIDKLAEELNMNLFELAIESEIPSSTIYYASKCKRIKPKLIGQLKERFPQIDINKFKLNNSLENFKHK